MKSMELKIDVFSLKEKNFDFFEELIQNITLKYKSLLKVKINKVKVLKKDLLSYSID